MQRLKKIWNLLSKSFSEWRKIKPHFVGAAVAFYVLFSLGQILVITVNIVGFIYGKAAAQGNIVDTVQAYVGSQPASIIQGMIQKASSRPSKNITVIVSVPILIFGGSMVFFQLRNALNLIWDVGSKAGQGFKDLVKDYFFSFLMVLFVGFLLLLLTLKGPVFSILRDLLNEIIPMSPNLFKSMDYFSTFIAVTLLFAVIYQVLPEIYIKWSDVWIGAAFTALLFTIAQLLIGFYVSDTAVGSAYGAIGSFTILFIWIFYSSMVFLYGAVFTRVYSHTYGSKKSR